MQPTLCSRCKKNVAVIFITRIENGESHNEGLCLRCARELHIKPVDEMMEKLGISDADLDNLTGDVAEMLGSMGMLGGDGAADADADASDADTDEDDGKTATFPFLNRLFNQNPPPAQDAAAAASEPPHADGSAADKRGAAPRKLKFLNNYCIDLTQRARDGKLDAMVGRAEELERVIQILNRRQKNNPCLIGEPGVGKTAIAEGLAQRIAEGNVPYKLRDKQVYLLDLTALVAGTQFRGQFESRMKGLIEEIRRVGNIILVIDEVHNIVGAGDAEGSMNAANILKPALSRGEIQVIGATTFAEYRKHIEKDAALERRFQPVTVAEPSIDDSVEILKGVRRYYEDFHGVVIPDDMCRLAVVLSERYITDRFFPDKAIDALDEAGSRVHVGNVNAPKEIEEIEEKIAATNELKLKAAQAQNFEEAASLRDSVRNLQAELDNKKEEWEADLINHREVVDEDKIAEVVAMMTGVPVQRIAQTESSRLLNMGDELKSSIVGQDEAIDKIVKAIQRNRVGLKDPNRPIGTFMFLGPTGVGKTHLAKKLSEFLFDSKDSLVRIDMSEYMEKFSVSRLVGAPPGYVGYEEGGQLTEKVRRHPYSVVLLDELEKAHADVFNMLLQVMDEGRLTDSLGRSVDFKNTIIIMTSNIGTRQLKDFGNGIGFNTGGSTTDFAHGVIQKALNKTFSPEFLNRVDDIVMFNELDKQALNKIIDIELGGFFKRVKEMGYTLDVTENARNFLVEKGYDKQFGARPLKRAVQQYLEDDLAEMILRAEVEKGNRIIVDHTEGNERLTCTIADDKD